MRSPKSRVLRKIEPEAKKRRRRHRFLSVYLFVLVLIALLCLVLVLAYAALLTFGRARLAQQKELVSGEIRLIANAIRLYHNDYGEYPPEGNASVVWALSKQRKERPGSQYYAFPPKRLKDGLFLDCWESPYIYIRTDGNFLIYSAGPNRRDDHRSGDDISP